MPDLIPYAPRAIGHETVQAVNGRDLYTFLQLTKPYPTWAKAQIKRARLVEHRDYEVYYQEGTNPQGGRPTWEYFFTFDAAKHIGMLSNTERGVQIREYFLQCEKALKAHDVSLPTLHDPKLRMMVEAIVRMDAMEHHVAQQQHQLALQQREIIQAQEMALAALRGQTWMTIRQYVYLHDLARQLPPTQQRAYATWLGGYCLEKGIPMYKALTADVSWPDERTYHVGALHSTLDTWLARRHGQAPLAILPVPHAKD